MRIEAEAYVNIRTHLRVDEILSGCMLAIILLHKERNLPKIVSIISVRGIWIFFPLWMLSYHPYGGALNYVRPNLAMFVVSAAIYNNFDFFNDIICHPVLRYIAKVSYLLYVWHPLFTLGWFSEGGRWALYVIKRPISIMLTFLFAHVSTNYFEMRYIKIARRLNS